jgi:hypothetical protein
MTIDNLQTGFLFLVHTEKGVLQRTIQWFTNCPYNHSGIIVIGHKNEIAVFEAAENGCVYTKLQEYKNPKYKILIGIPCVDDLESHVKEYLRIAHILRGKKYEFSNLLFFQIVKHISRKLIGKPIWIGRKNSKCDDKFICGELTQYIYNDLYGWFPEWCKGSPNELYASKKFKFCELKW